MYKRVLIMNHGVLVSRFSTVLLTVSETQNREDSVEEFL